VPLLEPVIDNRRFGDIVKEANTLIPRCALEQTDFNNNAPANVSAGKPVIFETDDLLITLTAQLKRGLARDGHDYHGGTEVNLDSTHPFEPFDHDGAADTIKIVTDALGGCDP